jgi:hypothetical protein
MLDPPPTAALLSLEGKEDVHMQGLNDVLNHYRRYAINVNIQQECIAGQAGIEPLFPCLFVPRHHIRIHNVGCHGNIDHQLSEVFAIGFNGENARLQVGESRLLSNSHAITTEFCSAMDMNLRMRAIPARSLSIENSTGPCNPRHASG